MAKKWSNVLSVPLRVSKDGSLRVPSDVVKQAGLTAEEEVRVLTGWKQLMVTESVMEGELMAEFVAETRELLPHVGEGHIMADGRTLSEYLALSEREKDALWAQAMKEAHDELEQEPEMDVPADYVPAGQKHRARRV